MASSETTKSFSTSWHFVTPMLAVTLASIHRISGAHALFAGILLAVAFKQPLPAPLKPWNSRLLGLAVVLLGAGTPLQAVLEHGSRGLGISAFLIALILAAGTVIGRALRVQDPIRTLISSGTAICGGSAIAATGPALGAGSESMGIAIAVVFLLNAVSVLFFPALGHALKLSPDEFGRFAALAIHDTSSVLAASVAFGGGAELTAVPMKLARALWIVPMAALLGYINRRGHKEAGAPRAPMLPWFIPAFVAVAGVFSASDALHAWSQPVSTLGKRLLVGTLFLIGNSITRETLRRTGARPLLLGVLLWGFAIVASYGFLRFS